MEKKSKLILSLIGLAALVVPILLLVFFTSKVKNEPPADGRRQINSEVINEAAKKLPAPNQAQVSPSPATASAQPSGESSQLSR